MWKPKIAVLGASRGLGKWFADFFTSYNFDVIRTWSSSEISNSEAVKRSDVIILATPMNVADRVIKEILPALTTDKLFIDVLSAKRRIRPLINEIPSEFVSLHPLFGPLAKTLNDKVILEMVVKEGERWQPLRRFLLDKGAIIIPFDFNKHDEVMAQLQLPVYFSFLTWLNHVKDKHAQLKTIPTLTYKLYALVAARILKQNPNLVFDMFNENEHTKTFIEQFHTHVKEVEHALQDKHRFTQLWDDIKHSFADEVEASSLITSNVVETLNTPRESEEVVFYLGPKGSHTYWAMKKWLTLNNIQPKTYSVGSVEEVFEHVNNNDKALGVVPAENSVEGYVNKTFDAFAHYLNVKVITSFRITITHALLSHSTDIKDIHTIATHPQAYSQCKQWVKEHCPQCHYIPTPSTSKAAEQYGKQPGVAIIGHPKLATLYHLNVLYTDIQDNPFNSTEFFIISRQHKHTLPKTNKALFMLSIYDRPGILKEILEVFAQHSINLTKIFSRPSFTHQWDYVFFIESEWHQPQLKDEIMKELKEKSVFTSLIGYTSSTKL